MTRRQRFLALPVLALALAAGACGGGDDKGGVATLDNGASSSAAPKKDLEKELNDYVTCLRDNGATVPDPTVDDNGQVSFGGAQAGRQIDRDKLQAAQKTCGPLPEGLTTAFDPDDPKLQDTLLKFAECMRAEGVDVPDPDFSKIGKGANPFGDKVDPDDPEVAAAIEVCQKVWTDAGITPRGGR
jgi:hypothetical protein